MQSVSVCQIKPKNAFLNVISGITHSDLNLFRNRKNKFWFDNLSENSIKKISGESFLFIFE